jgi:hypothetical protein
MAPRARFELATLRLTAEEIKNLSALFGVAYKKSGALFPSLVAPNPAPNAAPNWSCFLCSGERGVVETGGLEK